MLTFNPLRTSVTLMLFKAKCIKFIFSTIVVTYSTFLLFWMWNHENIDSTCDFCEILGTNLKTYFWTKW